MTRSQALLIIYQETRKWKVTAHPDDYDPTDDELVDLYLTAYNDGRNAAYAEDGLESLNSMRKD